MEERKSDEPKSGAGQPQVRGWLHAVMRGVSSGHPLTVRKPDSECHPPDCALASCTGRL